MHGPVAMVREDFPALLVAPRSRVFEEMRGLARRLEGLGVEVAAISDDEGLLGSTRHGIPLGCSAPDWLLPFVTVVPGQLLALHLTFARGMNPDRPERLRKVTKTF